MRCNHNNGFCFEKLKKNQYKKSDVLGVVAVEKIAAFAKGSQYIRIDRFLMKCELGIKPCERHCHHSVPKEVREAAKG